MNSHSGDPTETLDFSHWDNLWDVLPPETVLTVEPDPAPVDPHQEVLYNHPLQNGVVQRRAQIEQEKRAERIMNWAQGVKLSAGNPVSALFTSGSDDLSSKESLGAAQAGEFVWTLGSFGGALRVGYDRSAFNGASTDDRTFSFQKHVLPGELQGAREAGRGVAGPEKAHWRHDLRDDRGRFVTRQQYERKSHW
jgi:hypothetical protein